MNICLAEGDTDSAAIVAEAMVTHPKLPPSEADAVGSVSALVQAQAWAPAARLVTALEGKFQGSVPAAATAALLQGLVSGDVEALTAAEEAAVSATAEEEGEEPSVWAHLGTYLRGIPAEALQGELGAARQAAFEHFPLVLGGLVPLGADDSAGDDGAPVATLDAEEAAEKAAKA